MNTELENVLESNRSNFYPVVNFNAATEKLFQFNFTDSNTGLSASTIANTELFSAYVDQQLKNTDAKFGVGGYGENRTLYKRSEIFDGAEARSIHLGIDVWGPAGTEIYAALDGTVHSFANNDNFGDYGATIILSHQLDAVTFYTLYGHLSFTDIEHLSEGVKIARGELVGHFGPPAENGNWPPHLHFQIIADMQDHKGDYPGVCKSSESKDYLSNCPDADLILNMLEYV